jgi:hypothetical protein
MVYPSGLALAMAPPADPAGAAGHVLDDDGLTDHLLEPLGQQTGRDVGAAAGAVGDDQFHRFIRPGGGRRRDAQDADQKGQGQQNRYGSPHDFLLLFLEWHKRHKKRTLMGSRPGSNWQLRSATHPAL